MAPTVANPEAVSSGAVLLKDIDMDDSSGDEGISKLEDFYKSSMASRQKVRLEWSNINYSVYAKDAMKSSFMSPVYNEKVILDNVSGAAESGELLAIMGPTGCGKTSLMNILAARSPDGGSSFMALNGSIKLNGNARDEKDFRLMSSYVLQDDFMYAHLTVQETLMLASQFYRSEKTEEERCELVEAIVMELGLVKAKDTIIGNDKYRGVSGGERKRTNIGVHLITDPAVLFLDEPTSGLDSFQALAVMQCIKGLASSGRLVVSVIHQPRSSIYQMFDKMLLLSQGRDMYHGDVGQSVEYFAGCNYACPENFNPADYFLDILSPDARNAELEDESQKRIDRLATLWHEQASKHLVALNGAKTAEVSDVVTAIDNSSTKRSLNAGTAPLSVQLRWLSWRAWTEMTRDYFPVVAGTTIFTLLALMIGGIYSNIRDMSQASIQDRNGLLFFVGVNQGFNGLFGVLTTFPREKVIVNRDRANNAYGIAPYFCSKFLVELPVRIFPSILYSCIVYWIAGLNPAADRFGIFMGINVTVNLVAVALAMVVSAFTPTVEAANAVGPLFVIISIMFGGFYIDIGSLPMVADLIPNISFVRWSFQALTINEYKGLTFKCDTSGVYNACKTTGEEVLDSLSFGSGSVNTPIMGLYMCLLGFLLIAFVLLARQVANYISLGHVGADFARLRGEKPEVAPAAAIKDKKEDTVRTTTTKK